MNKLKTSTKVLIALAASALVLSVVLLLTIPEPWVESFKTSHSFIFDGTAPDFDFGSHFEDSERFHSSRRFDRDHNFGRPPRILGGILFIGLILFLIFKGKGFHKRRNHSRAIIDVLYAEEKITLEEYQRRRTVIEEEGK